VVDDVITDMVDELPPEVTVCGENPIDAPGGVPVALRATLWLPPEAVVPMVLVAVPPAVTLPEVGVAAMVKSGGGGAAFTVRVKLWLAGLPNPLLAPMVIEYELFEPLAGMPASVAFPLPLSVKLTPVGRAPLSVKTRVGLPVAVTGKVPETPWVKVVPEAEVMVGGVLTVREKLVEWVGNPAALPVPVRVMAYVPGVVVSAGVTEKVELPPDVTVGGLNDTRAPVGAPVSLSATDCDTPEVVAVLTEVVAAEPAVTVAAFGDTPMEKSLGGAVTLRVKVWVAGLPTPLLALMVMTDEETPPAVPAKVAVPLPLSTKVTPLGNAPDSDRAAVGDPVVVTEKVPELPAVKVVLVAEVMAGGVSTVRAKVVVWMADVPVAVTVTV
jgi:hypothetical protein